MKSISSKVCADLIKSNEFYFDKELSAFIISHDITSNAYRNKKGNILLISLFDKKGVMYNADTEIYKMINELDSIPYVSNIYTGLGLDSLKFNNYKQTYRLKLAELLNVDTSIINLDEQHFNEVSNIISKNKLRDLFMKKDSLIYLTVYVGEYLIVNHKGEWFFTDDTLNGGIYPQIKINNELFDPGLSIFREFNANPVDYSIKRSIML
jgi:hypothetical protein